MRVRMRTRKYRENFYASHFIVLRCTYSQPLTDAAAVCVYAYVYVCVLAYVNFPIDHHASSYVSECPALFKIRTEEKRREKKQVCIQTRMHAPIGQF